MSQKMCSDVMAWYLNAISTVGQHFVRKYILFLPLFTPLLQFSWRRGVTSIPNISCLYPTILASQKVICFSHLF